MSQPKIIVITAADALYSPLAHDTLASVRALNFTYPIELGLLDVGLAIEQRIHFEAQGVHIAAVQSDISFPAREMWEAKKPAIRTLTARPFLWRYFPSYDIYIWLDADVWVQTPEAINSMIAACMQSDAICIAAELDRCYRPFFENAQIWSTFSEWYNACFPEAIMQYMALKPMLNAGVFAMNKNSPLWDAWAQIYSEALQATNDLNEKTFMTDQLGLNILLYMKEMPCIVMPASFNWLTYYALPTLDTETGLYVEPQIPHRPISQFHLTRPNKIAVEHIQCVNGESVDRSLTYSARSSKA